MSSKRNGHPTNPPSSSPVRIEKLVPGGAGLGFVDDGAVFVPLSVPGDLVTLKHVRRSRGVWFAETDVILERSPHRREAPCPWFGLCGGCQWMHMDYGSQVRGKEDILKQALTGIARIREYPAIKVHPSPSEYHYRFRARLQIKGSRTGYYRRSSNQIIPWDHCLLIPPLLNQAAGELRARMGGREPVPGLKGCELALSPLEPSVTFNWILVEGRREKGVMSRVMKEMEEIMAGVGITVAGQAVHNYRGGAVMMRGGNLNVEVSGARLSASPGTFFQVNPEVNGFLVERVLAHLRSSGAASLLDLYCGNGNFSLPAAAAGLTTVGVESCHASVRSARASSGPNSRFVEMDAAHFLARDEDVREAVIVDPPRKGLPRDVTQMLAKKRIPTLLYVSCEPATLGRDLAHLTRAGYAIEDLELFDMFPQTSHAEVLVVMRG